MGLHVDHVKQSASTSTLLVNFQSKKAKYCHFNGLAFVAYAYVLYWWKATQFLKRSCQFYLNIGAYASKKFLQLFNNVILWMSNVPLSFKGSKTNSYTQEIFQPRKAALSSVSGIAGWSLLEVEQKFCTWFHITHVNWRLFVDSNIMEKSIWLYLWIVTLAFHWRQLRVCYLVF